MSKSNYTLTTEQKRILDKIAMDLEGEIEDRCLDHYILNVYDTPDKRIDNDMFTAILWYVGDQLSSS